MTTVETLLNDPDTAGVWNLVTDRSTVGFKIRNMWGLISVKGRFTDFDGDGQITGKGAIFGRLDIQAASLRTGIGKRDEHLRSADFFDVERFPEISVVVTAVEPGAGEHRRFAGHVHHQRSHQSGAAAGSGQRCSTTAQCGYRQKPRSTGTSSTSGWNRLGMMGKTATVSADAYFVRTPQ